jgi:hypothetical protein
MEMGPRVTGLIPGLPRGAAASAVVAQGWLQVAPGRR